jgi:uncharacterized membrane protein
MVLQRLVGKNQKNKSLYLLLLLVAFIVLYPVFEDSSFGRAFLLFMAIVVPLAAVFAVSDNRRRVITAGVLCVPAQLALVELLAGLELLPVQAKWILAPTFVFYVYALYILISHVLSREEITRDTLYGAAAVYLLMGLAWGLGYALVETLQPGSFYLGSSYGAEGAASGFDFFYASFVTLTTLGYGDFTPVTSVAKSMAILQAVSGVLYLAFLVSRLVGMYAQGSSEG